MTISQELARLCVVRGDLTLHSGEKSDWIFDFGRAWDKKAGVGSALWTSALVPPGIVAGIEFWGAMVAARFSPSFHVVVRKDGNVVQSWGDPLGEGAYSDVILFDDVVTTDASMVKAQHALEEYGFNVVAKTCILNRGNIPGIKSLVSMEDVEEVLGG